MTWPSSARARSCATASPPSAGRRGLVEGAHHAITTRGTGRRRGRSRRSTAARSARCAPWVLRRRAHEDLLSGSFGCRQDCSSRVRIAPGEVPGLRSPVLPTGPWSRSLGSAPCRPLTPGACSAGTANARRSTSWSQRSRGPEPRAGGARRGRCRQVRPAGVPGRHASGCGIARAAGVEAEMELAFAGLQQLCAPFSIASSGFRAAT